MLKGVPDERAQRPNGIYVPRFRNIADKHPDFLRGYGFQGGAEPAEVGPRLRDPRVRRQLQEDGPRRAALDLRLGGFGECLARFENFCELDKEKVDAWGIPVLHISMAFGDNERKMVADMARPGRGDAAGRRAPRTSSATADISTPGLAIHEVGRRAWATTRRRRS